MHSEEVHDLYSSMSITWMIKSRNDKVVYMAHIGKNRNACRVLVGKHEGKRPL